MNEDAKFKLSIGALALVGLGFLLGGPEAGYGIALIVAATIAVGLGLFAIDRIVRFYREQDDGKDKGKG